MERGHRDRHPDPARLHATPPGDAPSRFLRGIAEGRILGQRCPACHKVYVPPRGACPTCGVPTDEEVRGRGHGHGHHLLHRQRPVRGAGIELPYVAGERSCSTAPTSPDASPDPGVPADEVRMGMRVEAVWRRASERRPTPRAASATSARPASPTRRSTATRSTSDARRRRRLVRAVAARAPRRAAQRGRDADARGHRGARARPASPRTDIGFTVSGSSRLPGRAARSRSSGARRGRRLAADPESHVEMDGAWALYEAWVRLQHGDVDTALVYAFGKSSPGDLPRRARRCSSTRTTSRRCGPTR